MSSFTNHPLWKWAFPAPLRGPGFTRYAPGACSLRPRG